MSLISFVPDFNYAEQEMKDLASFYPSKDNVDNAFARWFVNDKNFIKPRRFTISTKEYTMAEIEYQGIKVGGSKLLLNRTLSYKYCRWFVGWV